VNFDFSEVLTRAWQITWKHKALWFLTALPVLVVFLVFLLMFVPLFLGESSPRQLTDLLENPIFILIAIIAYAFIFVATVFLQIVSRSSVTLGVLRAEQGIQPVTFMDLLKDGFQYFWRILGVFALINVTIGLVFFAFFACTMLLTLVTIGMAAICLQPVFILLTPLSLLVVALMEQAEAAVVADGMGVMDALKRGYELLKANIWKYVLVTLVIYFGMTVLMGLVMFPLMIPFVAISFSSLNSDANFQNMIWASVAFSLLFVPVVALVQGVSMTYLKSALVITYLRLTRSFELQPAAQEAVS